MQWQKNMQLLDANVILRYLLNDHAEMSLKTRDVISSGDTYTKPEVISEVIYVWMHRDSRLDYRNNITVKPW